MGTKTKEKICEYCGELFKSYPFLMKKNFGRFCSRQCYSNYRKPKKCSFLDCQKYATGHGLCRYHYNRSNEVKNRNNERYKKLKMEMLSHYSKDKIQCVKCGYNDIRALDLDHINGSGNLYRKQLSKTNKGGGNTIYSDIRKKRFPSGYQVLCRNCNWIKHIESKTR